jgi:hypothetical protein
MQDIRADASMVIEIGDEHALRDESRDIDSQSYNM